MARITYIPNRVIDSDGISDGAALYVFQAGTTTPVSLFLDKDLTTPTTNPYVVTTGATVPPLFTDHTGDLRLRVVASDGSVPVDEDPYEGPAGALRDDDGGSSVGIRRSETGAVSRTVQSKLNEIISVLDFGADPTGATDSTTAFENAAAASNGGRVFVPAGTYRIDQAGMLEYAGIEIFGEGGFKTVIKPASGATGPLLWNSFQNTGTSSLVRISNLFFDLEGEDITALDLGAVNRAIVSGCFFEGGDNYATRAGRGIRFHAPNAVGSYDNVVTGCSFQHLNRGVHFDNGGNSNELHGCNFIVCDVGIDAEPATGTVDTPRVFGGRCEGCRIGINDAAEYGHYFGVRFEAQVVADINFGAASNHPRFYGGYSATSPATLNALGNADSPQILSDELGEWDIESSASRPRIRTGKITYGKAGSSGALLADFGSMSLATGIGNDYSVFFYDGFQLNNNSSVEAKNATNDNTVQVFYVDNNNRFNIVGFDRKAGAYTRIFVGPNFNFNPNVGLEYAGIKVLGAQQAAIIDAAGGDEVAKINAILAALRAHGLIAT